MLKPFITSVNSAGEEWLSAPAQEFVYIKTNTKLTQPELEKIQLLEFQRAITPELAHLNFSTYTAHTPPKPDFKIMRGDVKVGLDLVTFAYKDRRRIQAQFSEVKQMFVDEFLKGRIRQYQWFEFTLTFSGDALRYPKKIKPAILEIIHVLDAIDINYGLLNSINYQLWDDTKELPPVIYAPKLPYPILVKITDKSKSVELIISGYQQYPSNRFMLQYGFDVTHQHHESFKLNEIKAIFDQRISDHDKEEYDELLIVAGGPDQNGIGNLDEPEAARSFINWDGKIETPKHLKRVVLFNWPHKTIHILHEAS